MSNGALKFRANGQTANTVVDPRFGVGPTPTQPAGWGGSGGGNVPPVVQPADSLAVYVAPSGDTTGATDHAAIQAAIDAHGVILSAQTTLTTEQAFAGGVVIDLIGTYWINAPLVMRSGVTLRGYGWSATKLFLAANSNSDMIYVPQAQWNWGIENMLLDGTCEMQSGGTAAVNVQAGWELAARWDNWGLGHISKLRVQYSYGHGYWLNGVESRILNCVAWRTQENGFHLTGSDLFLDSCTAGMTRKNGFYLGGLGTRVGNSKAYINGCTGRRDTASSTASQEFWDNNPALAPGGWFGGGNAFAINGTDHHVSNCTGEDCGGYAASVWGSRNIVDITSQHPHSGHLWVIGSDNDIRVNAGTSTNRENQPKVKSALTDHSNGSGNIIHMNVPNAMTTKFSDSWNSKSQYFVGTPSALGITTWASTITPDPLRGGVSVTATGATTIANTAVDRTAPGATIVVTITQDTTGGRAVTFGTDYLGMTAADTSAGKTSQWTIRRNHSGKWTQVGFSAY